jgi:hypothetical protein
VKCSDICAAVESNRPVSVPDGFGKAVRDAASKARSAREIGLIQQWRINSATRNTRQLQRMYAGVIDEGLAAGVLDANDAADGIDWENLLSFIERLIPLLLKLISLFG